MILTANFEVCIRFRSPHTSHTDFLHQRLKFPFLLPTPHAVSEPSEFLVAGIEHIASWSEAEGRLGSFPCWKDVRGSLGGTQNMLDYSRGGILS